MGLCHPNTWFLILHFFSLSYFRDLAVAAVLVGIILVFIFCHSFKFVVNIYEAYIMHFGEDNFTILFFDQKNFCPFLESLTNRTLGQFYKYFNTALKLIPYFGVFESLFLGFLKRGLILFFSNIGAIILRPDQYNITIKIEF